MFEQSSRPVKIFFMVLFVVVLAIIVWLAMRQNDSAMETPEDSSTMTNTQTNTTPPAPAAPTDPQQAEQNQPPVINVERDPNAPPLVSPEDALRERGMQSAPASSAPPAAPPTAAESTPPTAPQSEPAPAPQSDPAAAPAQ